MLMLQFGAEFFNNFNQKFYSSLISGLDLSAIVCSCGHSGCLIGHGSYTRKLKSRNGSFMLRVYRVRCTVCSVTHAIIPCHVVPYSQIPLDIQKIIVENPMASHAVQDIMTDNPDISEEHITHIKRVYKRKWRERIYSLLLSLNDLLAAITNKCVSVFKMQFMQIHRGQFFFFRPPT